MGERITYALKADVYNPSEIIPTTSDVSALSKTEPTTGTAREIQHHLIQKLAKYRIVPLFRRIRVCTSDPIVARFRAGAN